MVSAEAGTKRAAAAPEAGTKEAAATTEAGGSPPYAACPDVYAGKVSDPSRTDVGVQGLAALREKVLASRKVFAGYAAAHGGTYHYTRWTSSFVGSACKDTINVTNGMVESVIEQVRPDGTVDGASWSTPATYAADAAVPFCAPAATMDQLYDDCLDHTLCQDPRQNDLYVVVDARGLLVQCGYFPIDCADDCYEGFGSLLLTTDGQDWTKSPPGCCAPSPQPNCCMAYGGESTGQSRCGQTCDGMPLPDNPGWQIQFGDDGCAQWSEPEKRSASDCCGCIPLP